MSRPGALSLQHMEQAGAQALPLHLFTVRVLKQRLQWSHPAMYSVQAPLP